jgi:topoisomerase-4 subunit B
VPAQAVFAFPGGLQDYLAEQLGSERRVTDRSSQAVHPTQASMAASNGPCAGTSAMRRCRAYCNTVPTPDGGTHEQGLRTALLRGLRAYAELTGVKKGAQITADDVMTSAGAMLSVFVREPEFVGQTKDRLATQEAAQDRGDRRARCLRSLADRLPQPGEQAA